MPPPPDRAALARAARRPLPRTSRIAILGAGCAGLTCADELRALGYENTTIFEARARAGGKIRSVPYEGAPPAGRGLFEAGTVFFIPSPMWTRLLERHGVSSECTTMPVVRTADLRTGAIVRPLSFANGHSLPSRVAQVQRFLSMLYRHGPSHDALPGLAPHVRPELCVPARDYFEGERMSFVREVLLPIAGGAQFGPLVDDVPALYVVRLLTLLLRYGYVQRLRLAMPQLRVGHEALWAKIAAAHDVRFDEPAIRVQHRAPETTRGDGDGEIAVETHRGRYTFDAVIVALPPETWLRVADLPDEERALFGAVRTLDRVILTARVTGLGHLFCAPRYGDDGVVPPGHPYLFYEVDRGSGLYTFHPFLDGGATIEDAERAMATVVERLGGRVEAVVHRQPVRGWFPHFDGDALRAGACTQLEALQGLRQTFHVGELFAGVGVPHGMEYAARMVRAHIAGLGDDAPQAS